jgi:hypothetical protein
MSKTCVLRHFAPLPTVNGADNAVKQDVKQMSEQLLAIHRAYYLGAARVDDAAPAGLAAIVVCDDESLFDKRPHTPGGLQVGRASFGIPVGERTKDTGNDDNWLYSSDTLILTDFTLKTSDSITVHELERGGKRKVTLPSGSTRFQSEIHVSYAQHLPAGVRPISEIGFRAHAFATPDRIAGWVVVVVLPPGRPSFDLHNPICVPNISFKVDRVRSTGTSLVRSELTRSETLQQDRGQSVRAAVAAVSVFFDRNPGIPALTPVVARHVEACVQSRLGIQAVEPGADGHVLFKPFSDSRAAATSNRSELAYNGFVSAAHRDPYLYDIFRGKDGCGALDATSALIGQALNLDGPADPAGPAGRPYRELYFEVSLATGRVAQGLLEAAFEAAVAANKTVQQAIDDCEGLYKGVTFRQGEARAIALYGTQQAARGLYFWGYLRRTRDGIKLVSNSDRLLKAAAQAEPVDEAEDWEALLAQGEAAEARAQVLAEITSEFDAGAADYAANIREVVDQLMATETGAGVRFSLVDRRFPYDEFYPEMMTSLFLTPALTEHLRVGFRLPRNDEAAAHRLVMSLQSRIKNDLGVTRTAIKYGDKTMEYPSFSGMNIKAYTDRAASGPRTGINVSFTVFFAPRSGNAARVYALLHVLVESDIFIYVSPSALSPLGPHQRPAVETGPTLKSIKYIVGKDPRCTPSWLPAYADAVDTALRARKYEVRLINATKTRAEDKFISYHAVGAYADPRRMERLAQECVQAGKFDRVTTIEEADYIQTCIGSIPSQVGPDVIGRLLQERKLAILVGSAEAAFPELRGLLNLKRSAPPDAADIHERYGQLSRAYRQKVYRVVEVARGLSLATADIKGLFNFQGGLLMDIIDKCCTGGRGVVTRAAMPVYASEGGAGARVIRNQLWAEHHAATGQGEDEGEDIDLDEARRTEQKIRYTKAVEHLQADDGLLTTADRMHAIKYEQTAGFMGPKHFHLSMSARRNQARTTSAADKMIRTALDQTRIPKEVAEWLHKPLTAFYGRIKDEVLALDFLRRLVHWATEPTFNHADLPGLEIWSNDDPRAFHKWCVAHTIRTSAGLGEIGTDPHLPDYLKAAVPASRFSAGPARTGMAQIAIDTLMIAASNRKASLAVPMVELETGFYQEASGDHFDLADLVGFHPAGQYRRMRTELPWLPEAALRNFAVMALSALTLSPEGAEWGPEWFEKGVERPPAGRHRPVAIEQYLQALPEAQPEAMAIYEKAVKTHYAQALAVLDNAALGVAEAEKEVAEARAKEEEARAIRDEAKQARRRLDPSKTVSADASPDVKAALAAETKAKKSHEHAIAIARIAASAAERPKAALAAAEKALKAVCSKYGLDRATGQIDIDRAKECEAYKRKDIEVIRMKPETIDVEAFVGRIVADFRDSLDSIIYIAQARARQYVAGPIELLDQARPAPLRPFSSRHSNASSSELDKISSAAPNEGTSTPKHRSACPDGTTMVGVDFNFITSTYRLAPGPQQRDRFYGCFRT